MTYEDTLPLQQALTIVFKIATIFFRSTSRVFFPNSREIRSVAYRFSYAFGTMSRKVTVYPNQQLASLPLIYNKGVGPIPDS